MSRDICSLSGIFPNSWLIHLWSANLIYSYNQLKTKWCLAFSLECFSTVSVKTLPVTAQVHVCSSNNNLHQGCCCDNLSQGFVFTETQDVVWHNPHCSNRIADFSQVDTTLRLWMTTALTVQFPTNQFWLLSVPGDIPPFLLYWYLKGEERHI